MADLCPSNIGTQRILFEINSTSFTWLTVGVTFIYCVPPYLSEAFPYARQLTHGGNDRPLSSDFRDMHNISKLSHLSIEWGEKPETHHIGTISLEKRLHGSCNPTVKSDRELSLDLSHATALNTIQCGQCKPLQRYGCPSGRSSHFLIHSLVR